MSPTTGKAPKSFAYIKRSKRTKAVGFVKSFSSLDQHTFLMDGGLRATGTPMAKKYIARDPGRENRFR